MCRGPQTLILTRQPPGYFCQPQDCTASLENTGLAVPQGPLLLLNAQVQCSGEKVSMVGSGTMSPLSKAPDLIGILRSADLLPIHRAVSNIPPILHTRGT